MTTNKENLLALAGMGKIKLIIWDLDETFWRGILTEGGIEYIQAHHELVLALARRGVISSICSNNDAAPVQAYLQQQGLWDYFVFPRLSWTRKGAMVRDLIESAQLRSANVLFIDDKRSNLDEVSQACPGIMTALPERIAELIARVAELPESDPQLKRLQQYKVLENKSVARREVLDTGASADDFLRQSGIRVRFLTGQQVPIDRVVEMIERTNQLNFSRAKPHRSTLASLVQDSAWEAGCIEVSDKYGDYGIAGFYAVERKGGRRLLQHYLFSCRILNMQVEAWLYNHLGRPELSGITSTNGFEQQTGIDWITIDRQQEAPMPCGPKKHPAALMRGLASKLSYRLFLATQKMPSLRYAALWCNGTLSRMRGTGQRGHPGPAILLRGGCDTWAIADFLKAEGMPATREVGEWRQTLEALRYPEALDRVSLSTLSRALVWSGDLTLAHGTQTSELFSGYSFAALSLARDYKAGLYRYRQSDILLPIPPFDMDLTDSSTWPEVGSWLSQHGPGSGPWVAPCYTPEGLRWLKENCTPLTAEERRQRILDNITWCSQRAAKGVQLVLLTAPELSPGNILPMWRGVPEEARYMNREVAKVAAQLANVTLLPVQEIVQNTTSLADRHPFHYTRSVYRVLAQQLQQMHA